MAFCRSLLRFAFLNFLLVDFLMVRAGFLPSAIIVYYICADKYIGECNISTQICLLIFFIYKDGFSCYNYGMMVQVRHIEAIEREYYASIESATESSQ